MEIDNLALLDLQEATGIRSITELAIFIQVAKYPRQRTAWYAEKLELSVNNVTTILGGLADNDRRKKPLKLIAKVGLGWELTKRGERAVKGF